MTLAFKTIKRPIWTYRIQPWESAATFNVEILDHFQTITKHDKHALVRRERT